ncbi:hypothetical protein TeGR_g11485 [Tetraparma gracilis]|uniref:Uncharacterized protein n=1 Tax=Tetraparma gracilis TaxID=2962635 RepID=A0ABQ6N5B7_9STRA|nr:hypothetical protein TeGR_g11485 [Tetraparma gracilis]
MAARPSLSKNYSSAARRVSVAASERGMAPEDFLPMEFFDIREEISPKAPVKTLVKWGGVVYAILFIIFVSLFSFEMTNTNTSSTTTIVSSPPSPASDNIVCTPLATFSGSTDVQCEASPVFPNADRFYTENDPYGEGQDGFVTCGTMVRATKDRCLEVVESLQVCTTYKAAIEEHAECRENPGDSNLKYLAWGTDEPKTIRMEIHLGHAVTPWTNGAPVLFNQFGPFPSGEAVYTVADNSLSFGLAYSLGSWDATNVDQDTCTPSASWLSRCDAFMAATCQKVGTSSGPYACVATETTKATFFEALGTAYANLAFLQGLLLPLVAIAMVKAQEVGKKEGAELVPPSSPKSEAGDNKL